MTPVFAITLVELTEFLNNPWLKAVIVIVGAILGAFLTSFLVGGIAMLVWRELSRAAIFRLRVIGGIIGALLASLLNLGIGLGPGPGGLPGGPGTDQVVQQPPMPEAQQPLRNQQTLLEPKPEQEPRSEIEIELADPRRHEQAIQQNRFFLFRDDPQGQPVDLDTVMKRLDAMTRQGKLKPDALVKVLGTPHTPDPEYHPVMRELRKRVEAKGLTFKAVSVEKG